MIIKHRIPNYEYLNKTIDTRDMILYDEHGPYMVKARAHRQYRGLPAIRASIKGIKINRKTNAFWVYDTSKQEELITEVEK